MAESSENLTRADTKLQETFCTLTPLQRRIFTFLKTNEPSKAVTIAKGVGKTTAKDVNPDLYKMKSQNLLSHNNQEKLWTINTGPAHTLSGAPNTSSEDSSSERSNIEMDGGKEEARRDSGIEVTSPCPDNTMREEPNLTGPPSGESYLQYDADKKAEKRRSSGKKIELSELQRRIFTFLKTNEPSKAVTIAKGVGKTAASDVNPDLYKMKSQNLLSHNNQEKLWTINTGPAHTLSGAPNTSSEDSSSERSNIEMDGGKEEARRDSGIEVTSPCPDNTMREEPNLTGPPSGESYLQYGSPMMNPLPHVKIFNININGCHHFRVGDNTWLTKGGPETITEDYERYGHFSYGPGATSDFLPQQNPAHYTRPPWEASDQINGTGDNRFHNEYRDPGTAAQEAEQQDSALGRSQQSGDDLISELSLVNTEEDGAPFIAPRTSSPVPSSRCEQTFNISGICDGLGNVTLDDQDNNGEEGAVIPSVAAPQA